MAGHAIDLGAQLDAALDALYHSLGECTAFAELGESVGKLPPSTPLPEADVIIRFLWGRPTDQSLPPPWEIVGSRFPVYSARYAVLGMVTATEVFLARLRLLTRVVREMHQAGGTMLGERFNSLVSDERKKASRTSVERLIKTVLSNVGIPPAGVQHRIDHIMSIYKLRVCLSHREGIVGQEDVDKEHFTATWLKVVPEVDGVPVTQLPALIPGGAELSAPIREETRQWSIGEPIELTAKDCHHIAMTLTLACTHLRDEVRQKAVRLL